ncbi:metalloprotease [Lewinellaceae bacterium SD302]|nr:metalloprotease [Lewinellaceae bacterium SD302]
MRWQGRKQSSNVDDRRGKTSSGRKAAGGFGIGTIIIIILGLIFGFDPSSLLGIVGGGGGSTPATTQERELTQSEQQSGAFASVVLQETENTFNRVFRESYGANYQEPVMVLFSGQTQSGCGFASAATGPFYCPADKKVYIDLSFANTLRDRFGASGDFAMAYVIAHEVGHHVQNLLGYSQQVQQARGRVSKAESNQLSVRLELMADYLAGVWAHDADRSAGILEEGDIREAITAASAIGDDSIQKRSQGYVVPESFTHGTSEQRMKYFSAGYKSGDASKGTLDQFFSARDL